EPGRAVGERRGVPGGACRPRARDRGRHDPRAPRRASPDQGGARGPPMRFRVRPTPRLAGSADVPGDKSVSHRAALLGALAEGITEIHGYLEAEDCLRTITAVQALGAQITRKGPRQDRNAGGGRYGWREPSDVIDCGNSGTSARLLVGVLAGQPFWTMLTGDESLRTRPMGRVAEPLRRMGAAVVGRAGGTKLPLAVKGTRPLRASTYESPRGSAAVETAGGPARPPRRRPRLGERAGAAPRRHR